MAIVLVFAVWELSARAGAPAGAIVAVSVFVGLLTAGIVWTLTVTTANLGVALSDEGLALFTTRLRFGQVSRRDIRWDELSEPEENSRGGDISVSTTGFPIVLTHEQAKVVLSDPRCPLRNHLPSELVASLGIAPESSATVPTKG